MNQFKGQSKMSHLEYTCSPRDSQNKMRYNSTGRKKQVRLQLALDVYESATPHVSLNTMLLIEMVEEKQLPGMFRRQHPYFLHKPSLKGQEWNSELLGIHFPPLSTLQMTSPRDKTPE